MGTITEQKKEGKITEHNLFFKIIDEQKSNEQFIYYALNNSVNSIVNHINIFYPLFISTYLLSVFRTDLATNNDNK